MQLLKIEHKNLLINIKKLKTKLKIAKTCFKEYAKAIGLKIKNSQDLYLKMIKMEAFENDKNKCRYIR